MVELSPRERVIVAAIKRQVGQSRIAAGLGVSISCVHGLMRRAEKKIGPLKRERVMPRNCSRRATIRDRLCEHCGAGFIWERGEGPLGVGRFCSNACSVAAQTKIDPVRAIEARKACQTWRGIAIAHGATISAVQRSVWLYLKHAGLLTEDTVAAIFRPAPGIRAKSYTTAALRRKFGDVPSRQEALNG